MRSITPFRVRRSVNPYYSGQPSDHFDGLRFLNPDHAETDRGFRDILRWKLKESPTVWPRSIPVRQAVPQARVAGLTRHFLLWRKADRSF
jgi:hypothetical protein